MVEGRTGRCAVGVGTLVWFWSKIMVLARVASLSELGSQLILKMAALIGQAGAAQLMPLAEEDLGVTDTGVGGLALPLLFVDSEP